MKSKLTKNDIDKVMPPKHKEGAIEQSERYEKEYEISKKELDDILKKMEKMMDALRDKE